MTIATNLKMTLTTSEKNKIEKNQPANHPLQSGGANAKNFTLPTPF